MALPVQPKRKVLPESEVFALSVRCGELASGKGVMIAFISIGGISLVAPHRASADRAGGCRTGIASQVLLEFQRDFQTNTALTNYRP